MLPPRSCRSSSRSFTSRSSTRADRPSPRRSAGGEADGLELHQSFGRRSLAAAFAHRTCVSGSDAECLERHQLVWGQVRVASRLEAGDVIAVDVERLQLDEPIRGQVSVARTDERLDVAGRDIQRLELNQIVEVAWAIADLREAIDVTRIGAERGQREQVIDARHRVACGMQCLDEVAADVQRHHSQALVLSRPLHTSANEEVVEACVRREVAGAGCYQAAAAPAAIEPPGFADECETDRLVSACSKLGDVETLQLTGIEVGRPVRRPALAAGEAGVDLCGTALSIDVEANSFGHARGAGG